ncbi:methylase [Lasiosphaeria hispida]|uniref:Methylase n=1 Tax=Lasiosphaeria hispida TaxID=260671 RepID=A0AAJ0HF53_9PEZI|nr:methylase [Lasiosphaeria hispida]
MSKLNTGINSKLFRSLANIIRSHRAAWAISLTPRAAIPQNNPQTKLPMAAPAPSDADTRFWDKTSLKYSQSPISDQAGYQRTLDKTITLLKPDHAAVELGCGTGSTAIQLSRHVRSFLGTDISSGMIDVANKKISAPESSTGDGGKEEIQGLAFRVATAEELVSATEKFNVVLGFNYLHLVRDMPGTLKSVNTLLVPGGLFISKTPCIRDMTFGPVLLPVISLARVVGLAPSVAGFTAGELNKQIEAAGFEVLETEYHASGKGDTRPFIVARKVAV